MRGVNPAAARRNGTRRAAQSGATSGSPPHLPGDFPAAVFVVVHFPGNAISTLAQILRRAGPLPALNAQDGQRIEPGRIYVAPPDQHLLVKPGYVKLAHGPKENGFRPAINPLFRTAAAAYGPRVVGVVLSGTLDDGTIGLQRIKDQGGFAIVQDPEDALFDAMPRSAIAEVAVDTVLPVAQIGEALSRLVIDATRDPAGRQGEVAVGSEATTDAPDPAVADPVSAVAQVEPDVTELFPPPRPGEQGVTGLTCPECGGALWEMRQEGLPKYQYRVGHSYSEEALLVRQGESLEAALWAAVRALEERAALTRSLAHRMGRRGPNASSRRFARMARQADEEAKLVRTVLGDWESGVSGTEPDEDPAEEQPIQRGG